MKKILALVLLAAMLVACFACLASCNKNDKNVLSVCLSSEPDTIDPALNSAVDGATLVAHLFQGLAKWSQDDKGNLVIVADAAKELPAGVKNNDGTVTYTYTLRDGLKWSDGKDVKASDFVFAWNRAASPALGADYGYMFDVVKGYDEMWEQVERKNPDGSVAKDENGDIIYDLANPNAKLDVVADDTAKTIKVTLKNDVAYWNELLAFPTYYPVRSDVVSNESWATEPSTYVNNGPYVIDSWTHDSVITLKKNDNYIDKDTVTMPTIKFYLSDDASNMLINFESGEWQLIDDVPTAEIPSLKTEYPNEFVVSGQIGTYYVCFNVNESLLPSDSNLTGTAAEAANAEIRAAMGLLIDRNYLVENISQAGEVPANTFVPMGMTDADGKEFYKNANGGKGYYSVDKAKLEDNIASAVATLKKYYNYDENTKKFTNVPSMTYIYNTNDGHKAIAEYIQSKLAAVGITMTLTNQEWNTFLNTRKDGNYTVARNGWLADYNDPISFLDMWTSGSGNNDVQYGKGDHANLAMYSVDVEGLKVTNGTWAQTYDELIKLIKAETNKTKRYQLMHAAEDLLMSTGAIVPVYYYTDIYMIDDNVEGFFCNPLGYKYFMYCTRK